MKKNISFALFFCLSLLLMGCVQKDKSSDMHIQEQSNNPFNLNEMEESGANVQASYGYSIVNYDKENRLIEYKKEEEILNIEYAIDNSGKSCEVGMIMFMDGIPQSYIVNGVKEYIFPVFLEEKSKKNVSVLYHPSVVDKGAEHRVFFACIYEPHYVASEENNGYGNYHNILPMLPWTLEGQGNILKIDICKEYEVQSMNEEFRSKYIDKNSDGTIRNRLEHTTIFQYLQDGEVTYDKINIKDGKAKFQIQAFGDMKITYRLSAFVNNEPVDLFDGCSYLDISVEKDKITVINIDMNIDDIKLDKFNSLDVFYAPIETAGGAEDPIVDKVQTISLVNE